jgi:uncharacterized membrane protein YphA (DoxX/SURF4 family)
MKMRLTLTILARWVLGGIFIYASADKILNPLAFAKIVHNYQILPAGLINLTAIFLPWLELLIGIALITGVWLQGSVAWATGLMGVFFATLLFNIARGLDIHCGCFSTSVEPGEEAPMVWYLVRDGAILALSGYLFLHTFILRKPLTEVPGRGLARERPI